MQMIPGDPFSISSSMGGFVHQETHLHHLQQQIPDLNPNSNPNPNVKPNSSSAKKKRNQPGTPDPDADVIALSPTTLMATNRFVCEICNKGFQRDQNLQLHRRGHNLPWKLKQRSKQEVIKKKVYICPIKTCVHHDASRALGDLTGIKKHYSRKHGEKKWKCEKCSKKYAVQSDWKAHAKTCGTREYKCDCGTLFSRKDSFITHRAFCDALTEEGARMSSLSNNNPVISTTNLNFGNDSNVMNNPNLPHGFVHRGVHHPDINAAISQFGLGFGHDLSAMHAQGLSEMVQMASTGNHHLFPSSSSSLPDFSGHHQFQIPTTSTNPNLTLSSSSTSQQTSASIQHQTLKDSSFSPLFSSSSENKQNKPLSPMSATALLQKAAQMGSTRSNSTTAPSFFAGPTMTSSSATASPPPPPRSSSPMMIQQQLNNFNTNVSRENHNLAPPPLSGVTTSCVDNNPFQSNRSGLNAVQQMGLTRDFLGVSNEHHPHQTGRRPFMPQELARFAPLG
ncbi:Zinc finger C2H2 superfamily [Arabidopsis suecica]|uniref:Zinc finger C2H2 superfamily n=1 Tax=Arabidopsis suecica TaxID=45249 RepID=A0A8T1Z6D0_ARASU|nr:Zinc finger C2H2 superfamily [Arabidopsis suecica]